MLESLFYIMIQYDSSGQIDYVSKRKTGTGSECFDCFGFFLISRGHRFLDDNDFTAQISDFLLIHPINALFGDRIIWDEYENKGMASDDVPYFAGSQWRSSGRKNYGVKGKVDKSKHHRTHSPIHRASFPKLQTITHNFLMAHTAYAKNTRRSGRSVGIGF